MSPTTYVCEACGAELRFKDDLSKEVGDVYAAWNCGVCGTRVPGIVAERLKHQRR